MEIISLLFYQVLFGDITDKGVQHLKDMAGLKEVRFFVRDRYEREEVIERTEKLYALLVEHMPQLRVVGNKTTDSDHDTKFQFNSIMPQISPDIAPGLYCLQHLHTSHSLPALARLPDLTHLYFRGPMTKVRSLVTIASYSSLVHLTLANLSTNCVENFLEPTGHQLAELRLESLNKQIDMYLVLHLCPNLKSFIVHDCADGFVVKYPILQPKISCMKFPKFEEFRATFSFNPFNLLKFLLMQPNITAIFLSDVLLGPEDFDLENQLPRASFSHLQSFELRYLSNSESDITAVGNICRFVLPRAPNLLKFAVSWSDSSIFDRWCDQESELFDLSSSLL
jgi:hypothetical protein